MITELSLLLLVAVSYWYYVTWLPPDYPPTPLVRLPLLGHMHYLVPYFLTKTPGKGLDRLNKRFGKNGIICVHFGPFKMVMIGEGLNIIQTCDRKRFGLDL
jgi:hypothetical protein